MEIISYRPSDDQFWIGCSKAEAEKFFLPLLDQCGLDHYNMIMRDKIGRDRDYWDMIRDTMGVERVDKCRLSIKGFRRMVCTTGGYKYENRSCKIWMVARL